MQIKKLTQKWSENLQNDIVYIPPVGLVNIYNQNPIEFLHEILSIKNEDNFKSYEPNKRWFSKRTSYILSDKIIEKDFGLCIPCVNKQRNTISIYIYSNPNVEIKVQDIKALAQNYQNNNYKINIITFNQDVKNLHPKKEVIIFTKNLKNNVTTEIKIPQVKLYNDLTEEERLSIAQIKGKHLEGITYFWNLILKEQPFYNSPILCYIQNSKVIGLLGPIDIFSNYFEKTFIFGPYFGVIPKYQKKGVGKALWQNFMNLDCIKNIDNLLLQAQKGSTAELFYRSQLLKEKGIMRTYIV